MRLLQLSAAMAQEVHSFVVVDPWVSFSPPGLGQGETSRGGTGRNLSPQPLCVGFRLRAQMLGGPEATVESLG